MIKRFSEFSINELKSDTYRRAATQLRKMGGTHRDRAKNLYRHSYIIDSKEFGTFNLNLNITQKLHMNYITKVEELMYFVKRPDSQLDVKRGEKIVENSPISSYITNLAFNDPKDAFSQEEMQDCTTLDFMFFAMPVDEKIEEPIELFMLAVPIIWTSDEEFELSDAAVEIWSMDLGIVKFSDRKSANNFKNKCLSQEGLKKLGGSYFTNAIREFFMEYSSATELEKFYQKIKQIPTNSLYE